MRAGLKKVKAPMWPDFCPLWSNIYRASASTAQRFSHFYLIYFFKEISWSCSEIRSKMKKERSSRLTVEGEVTAELLENGSPRPWTSSCSSWTKSLCLPSRCEVWLRAGNPSSFLSEELQGFSIFLTSFSLFGFFAAKQLPLLAKLCHYTLQS